jgi:uncharacterized protein with PQ loop repeat
VNQGLANAAAIVATIGTVTFLIPQIVKLLRTGDSAGVSPTWASIGMVTNIGWFTYLVSQGLWAPILAPLVTTVAYAITLWALVRSGRDPRRSLWIGAGWGILLVFSAASWGWSVLGVVLGFSYAVMLAPSVWEAYSTDDPSGVSPGTWWIGLAEAALYGYYGLFHADTGIMIFAVVGMLGSALMLLRYYNTRRPAAVAH